jgi:L-2-hydroxyglutarate oxidase LhgO
MSYRFDLLIVGGGIVGLATALKMAERYPRVKLAVLDKEEELARHQTGHNSGVIHSGIYYKPGSVKAETCVAGKRSLLDFCDRRGIPYQLCGKVIVASRPDEIPKLEELHRRGVANGVRDLEIVGPDRLKEIEPHVHGIKALYAPSTGIIDFRRVALAYAEQVKGSGGKIFTGHKIEDIVAGRGELTIVSSKAEFQARHLINCAGLHSDRVAAIVGEDRKVKDSAGEEVRIVPFRGEYFRLVPERRSLINGLVYPVPDPRFPFLGAHFTRTVHGEVEVGPNAVLALAREGYRKSDVDPRHVADVVFYPGFWRMAFKYWRAGIAEIYRSLSKRAFVRDLRRLVPEVREDDFVESGAGVRAQAVSARGALIDDFSIRQIGNTIHVLNAPSPGATASLAIGERIAGMAARTFSLE